MTRAWPIGLAATVALAAAPPAPPVAALPLVSPPRSVRCARCHTSPPQLNAYGTRYLLAGHRGDDGRDPGTSNAPTLPSIVVSSGLPLARWAAASGLERRGEMPEAARRPIMLDAHGEGALTRNAWYGVAASLDSLSGRPSVPMMFFECSALGSGARAVRVGRFETGLPFLSADRRATLAPYLAPVTIAAEGIELRESLPRSWVAVVGRIMSRRAPARSTADARWLDRLEDTFVWATGTFGEQVFGARVLFDRQDSNISYHAWLQRLQVSLGASLGTRRFRIVPSYLLDRFDDRPAPGIHQRHQYVGLEALVLLDPEGRCTVSTRLEHEHVTPTVWTRGEDHDLEVFRASRWIVPNACLALEASRTGDNVGGPRAARLDASVTLAY
jgi:hypothetical protein